MEDKKPLIIGYKPARKLSARYEKKGWAFRWVKPDKIETRKLDGYEVAHRKLGGENVPIVYKHLVLMGRRA
jgi:hypothetical protein